MDKVTAPSWPISLLPQPLAALALRAQSIAVPPIIDFAKSTVVQVLKRIETGRIMIMDHDGEATVCGRFIAAEGEPCTELRVLKELFWVRVLLFADMVRSDTKTLFQERTLC